MYFGTDYHIIKISQFWIREKITGTVKQGFQSPLLTICFIFSELSKYLGGTVLSLGPSNTLTVLITFDENVPEPRQGKFELDEEEAQSRLNTPLTYTWNQLVEPRQLPN